MCNLRTTLVKQSSAAKSDLDENYIYCAAFAKQNWDILWSKNVEKMKTLTEDLVN